MGPVSAPALNVFYFAIEVKLKKMVRCLYLPKTAVADGITDLGEFPGPFFIEGYAEIVKLEGFHRKTTFQYGNDI
jgi:hypothetical protein